MEGLASGLCVISTNVGGVPYLLDDGQDSLLVPPNDLDTMTAAVRRVLSEPGVAAQLSCNARAKAEQFDWSVVLPRWDKLLSEIAQKNR
jgi:glycosyltransferase involved in cell wall biosynthesis